MAKVGCPLFVDGAATSFMSYDDSDTEGLGNWKGRWA